MKAAASRRQPPVEDARRAAMRDAVARRPPCPHCAQSGSSGSSDTSAAGFSQVPTSRSVKTEAAFDDDNEGKGEGEGTQQADAGTLSGTADASTPAAPADAGAGGTADAGIPMDSGSPAPVTVPVPSISWGTANSSTLDEHGSSTTLERAFTPTFTAVKDTAANVWRMGTSSITGGANIVIRTGGSTDPVANPPDSEAKAAEAVTVMKGYYARGKRGKWHTKAASVTHEDHHYREWKCAAEHYWASAGPAIAQLTAPLASHADSAAAVAAMKPSANAKVASFKAAARTYWMKLSDAASSRPFAAGQAVLNEAVKSVQALAKSKGWTVEADVTTTSGTEPPCYEAWDAFTP